MRRRTLLRLFSTFVLSLPFVAHALTLSEATEGALAESHEIRQARIALESTRWGETKARAGFLPKIDLNARRLFNERFMEVETQFAGTTFITPATEPYTSLGLTVSIEAFSGFQTTNELAAAQAALSANEQRLERLEMRTRAEIRSVFYRALGAQILVEVAEQNIKTLEGHLSDINARVKSGVATRFDVLRIEVQLDDARTEKLAAENHLALTRARLFAALGKTDDKEPLAGKLPDDFNRIDFKQAGPTHLERTDRRALALDVEHATHMAHAARSHWYPRLTLFGSEDWYNNVNTSIWATDNRFKTSYSIGARLRWNLFDGGASLASERQAELAQRLQEEKLASLDRNVPVELDDAKQRLTYDIVSFKAKQSSVRKAEEAVRLAQSGLRAGTRTNTEVLDAVVDLNRARAAVIKVQVDAIDALGQLELASGRSLASALNY